MTGKDPNLKVDTTSSRHHKTQDPASQSQPSIFDLRAKAISYTSMIVNLDFLRKIILCLQVCVQTDHTKKSNKDLLKLRSYNWMG
jgi:hypothetical protein